LVVSELLIDIAIEVKLLENILMLQFTHDLDLLANGLSGHIRQIVFQEFDGDLAVLLIEG
jgi:hypothetical protein